MKYIFLSYINRSGSTFFVNQLSKSAEICICPESDALFEVLLSSPEKNCKTVLTKRALNYLYREKKYLHWGIAREELVVIAESCEKCTQVFIKVLELYARKHKPNAKVVLYKHNNLLSVNVVKHFTGDEFYHQALLRSPYGVYESQKRTISPYTQKAMSKNPVEFAYKWNKFASQILQSKAFSNFRLIEFASLMSNTNGLVSEIISELGVESVILNDQGDADLFLSEPYKKIHEKAGHNSSTGAIQSWEKELTFQEVNSISIVCRQKMLKLNLQELPDMNAKISVRYLSMQLRYVFSSLVHLLRRIKRRLVW